jgi:hypothetical protein
LARRATLSIVTERTSAQGSGPRRREIKSILLTDGTRTGALLSLDQTPFTLGDAGGSWKSLVGSITPPAPANFPQPIPSLHSLRKGDPRLLIALVPNSDTNSLATAPYRIATDPFRFPKSLLISPRGEGYGECTFRLSPELPGYLEMDSRFLNRLQGEYAPSSGDLVLTLGGEFLGVMINDHYCALVPSLETGTSLPLDSKGAQQSAGAALTTLQRATAQLDSRLR